jgi:hypothetical protein
VAQRYRVRTIVKATKSSNGERVIEKTAIHVDPNPRVTILPFRKGRLIRERKGEKDTVKRAGKWVQVGSDNLTAHIENR